MSHFPQHTFLFYSWPFYTICEIDLVNFSIACFAWNEKKPQ
jgi:hypothetical protein